MKTASQIGRSEDAEASWLQFVASQVKSLRFGVVQIVVHDSRVVQIDRTERLRIDKSEPSSSAVAGFVTQHAGDAYSRDKVAAHHSV